MDNEKKVFLAIKKNPIGLTITEVVNKTGLSRSTVRTILAKFEGAKKVQIKNIGMAKLYSLTGSEKDL